MKRIYWIIIVLLFFGCSTPKSVITSDINVTREITEEPRIVESKVACSELHTMCTKLCAMCTPNESLCVPTAYSNLHMFTSCDFCENQRFWCRHACLRHGRQ